MLRPLTSTHSADLYHVHRDKVVSRLLAGVDEMTRDHSDRLLQAYVEHWALFGFGFYLVYGKRPQSVGPCGRCGLRLTPAQEVELGYCFTAETSGRGLATEAASAVVKSAFDELRVDRLVAFVRPGNDRSLRVLEKLGAENSGLVQKTQPVFRYVLTRPVPND
ncbi:GNAT family N-acetyltransferase [Ensifer sp. NM-2]|uniref:GNAT family N-acetyltransferase n=1 Tax=Ensifer sp. NM-2 TaxID=2109730 RepID=UPI001304DD78|nr:GNAT family N-acetyltransferase [Ensifer sp. NM-2]